MSDGKPTTYGRASAHSGLKTRILLVAFIGLTVSTVSFLMARKAEQARLQTLFQQYVNTTMQVLGGRVDRYEGMLLTLRTLFNFSSEVTHQEFSGAASQLISKNPEMIALEWIQRFPTNDTRVIEKELRRLTGEVDVRVQDREQDGTFIPTRSVSDEYWPIVYVEPLAKSRMVVGYDVRKGPNARFLNTSMERGETVLTDRLTISQLNQPLGALIAILPVYWTPTIPGTPEDRRLQHRGFLQAVFDLNVLMSESAKDSPLDDLDFTITDPKATPEARTIHSKLGRSTSAAHLPWYYRMLAGELFLSPELNVGARKWVFDFRATEAWIQKRYSLFPVGVFGSGILLSVLVVHAFWRGGRERQRIELKVHERTVELTGVNRRMEREIEERRNAEQDLLKAHSMLLAAQRIGKIGSWERDFTANTLTWSDEVFRIFGRTKGSFEPTLDAFFASVHPDDIARLRAASESAWKTRAPYDMDYRIIRPDGAVRHVVIHAEPVLGAAGMPERFQGAIQDITTRKLAEVALIEAKSQLVAAQRLGHIGSWEADLRTMEVTWSDETFRICGMEPGALSPTAETFYGLVHPDDLARVKDETDKALKERLFSMIQHRILLPNRQVRWVIGRCEIQRGPQGEPIRALGTIQDVTDQKEAELERESIARNMVETQKLESLGLLAGGIAHDFNNLLTGILGSANLARIDIPRGHSAHEHLERVENAANRAAELCGQMLAYAGKSKPAMHALVIGELVRESASLFQVSLSSRARLVFDLAPSTPVISGDPVQLRQIIMNLVINASEAMPPEGGLITLSTQLVRISGGTMADAHLAPELAPGEYAQIEVRDTGLGMPPEVLNRIFDPFYTTKFAGRGLGLSAVSGIIRGHAGAIRVQSTVGVGTCFTILLPAEGSARAASAASGRLDEPWQGEGRVLVIEDEYPVRTVVVKMLEHLGFEVDNSSDAEGGLKLFRAVGNSYRIVLLDLTMPGVEGEVVLEELRKIRPDVRVLIMSGHAEEKVVARFQNNPPAGFIQKPFSLPAARRKLRELLGGPAEPQDS